ncbi:MAG TPA: tRNA preQ1(34) S-adenosylmethionine ribosyltransferase-isomerase QueA, partial [Planctomycetota bacterium]|nr:tRNA preQ1(34) S-adenosylmethionine ribosyltransferase-isomerase QueA [Planctomycetota bacterium]
MIPSDRPDPPRPDALQNVASELIDYDLPEELIAQEPAPERSASRLLVLDRASGRITHERFSDIERYLAPGDLLVVNDTRVIPARVRARRSGGGKAELLLLEAHADEAGTWQALLRPGKAGRVGNELVLEGDERVRVRFIGREQAAFTIVFLEEGRVLDRERVHELLARIGETPLPPYIRRAADERRRESDRERYQTVFAARPGAAAAPTAGLHFTREILDRLASRGIERASVTLHVGIDTFRPIGEEELRTGRLHGERVEIDFENGEAIARARREGRRIVAVGTTTVRALESFALAGKPLPYHARTRLFIRPGHAFQLVDAMVTNFHLPRSSLLLLVAAFAGRERVLAAYSEA